MTTNSPFVTNLDIDKTKLPKHIAIIMDGNRRWARQHGLPDGKGHEAGAQNLNNIVDHCRNIGIEYITVYALSTENWRKRSLDEVKGLFNLLIKIVKDKKDEYARSGVRFSILGNYKQFPAKVKSAIKTILDVVVDHQRIVCNVALNYGGRDELISAIKHIVDEKIPSDKITEELISSYLYTKDQPDPDLIIRPGGEKRLSNFLLWQSSYAELYFSDVLWPDFGPEEIEKAIFWYQDRDRRMGK